jgi:hypothetical protein
MPQNIQAIPFQSTQRKRNCLFYYTLRTYRRQTAFAPIFCATIQILKFPRVEDTIGAKAQTMYRHIFHTIATENSLEP